MAEQMMEYGIRGSKRHQFRPPAQFGEVDYEPVQGRSANTCHLCPEPVAEIHAQPDGTYLYTCKAHS